MNEPKSMEEYLALPEAEKLRLTFGEIVTHGGSDRGNRLCRCSACGFESLCTPFCDFYTRPDDPEGPLLCENCVMAAENPR